MSEATGPGTVRALPGPGPARAGYDRVPPHNLDAEVSVLGAMLLSRDAIAEVSELIRPEDFYRGAHRTLFEAARDLYDRGEPVDPVTLADELERRGQLEGVGGSVAVADLVAQVPTAANAAYYARIVSEQALRRRLIDAGTQITRFGYDADAADEAVDQAEALVYQVAQRGHASVFTPMKELLTASFELIERLHESNSAITGLATGFHDLDDLTAGLQPTNLVILAARPAMGKCLAGSTPVLDPTTGSRRPIAELVAAGRRGRPTRVATLGRDGELRDVSPAAYHDNGIHPVFRLRTRLGRQLVATANHPLLTPAGWLPVDALGAGDRIAGLAVAGAGHLAAGAAPGSAVRTVPVPSRGDLVWDEVVAIDPAGVERVYDLTVPGDHNFVAGDLVVHNSTLVTNMATHVAVELRRPVVMFSLEMSKMELVQRILAGEGRVDSERLRTGRLHETDWPKLSQAMGRLAEAPLFIDDTPGINLMEIRSKCRRLKQKHGLDLVIVDYLQLMQAHRRSENRVQEVSELSRGLKILAKELDVPVLALSQLSRRPEDRTDRRPQLSDLRESGSIEQDADVVAFIYRDEVYDQDSPAKGEAELIVAKHRNGPLRTVRLSFIGHHSRFASMARAPGPPAGGGPVPPGAPL